MLKEQDGTIGHLVLAELGDQKSLIFTNTSQLKVLIGKAVSDFYGERASAENWVERVQAEESTFNYLKNELLENGLFLLEPVMVFPALQMKDYCGGSKETAEMIASRVEKYDRGKIVLGKEVEVGTIESLDCLLNLSKTNRSVFDEICLALAEEKTNDTYAGLFVDLCYWVD